MLEERCVWPSEESRDEDLLKLWRRFSVRGTTDVEGRTPGSFIHHLIPPGRLDEHRTVSVASDTMFERLAVIRSDYSRLPQLSVDVGRLHSQENFGTGEW